MDLCTGHYSGTHMQNHTCCAGLGIEMGKIDHKKHNQYYKYQPSKIFKNHLQTLCKPLEDPLSTI